MSKKQLLLLAVCTLCLAMGSFILAAPAQQGGGFAIPWWTVDGGGQSSSGGAFNLRGTIGQADAGRASGGVYELTGGFWNSSATGIYQIHLPAVIR
jgi:hypothetical protein